MARIATEEPLVFKGKKVLLTGGNSGIGRAVTLAYAREGADLVVSYLNEHEDAAETKRLVEEAGRQCLLVAGDISKAERCRSLVQKTVEAFGRNRCGREQRRPSDELQCDRGDL